MKIKLERNIILALICILLLVPSISFAHGMHLKLVEPGVIQVEYDGGGFSPKMEVTLYDNAGNELEKGLVDEEGKYHFDENLDVHKAVADDGIGHRVEYEKGVEQRTIPKIPVVIGVFAVIGIIFMAFNKRAKQRG